MIIDQSTRSEPVLVGIDIAKNRHEVLIGIPGRKRRRRVTITNTRADFDRLTTLLLEYGLPVRVGFEATGNYHSGLLAPGGELSNNYPGNVSFTPGILSSVPGNKFDSFQGTSMASPHVASIFAAIRSSKGCGSKSVNSIESALKKKGKKIKDVNHTKPRTNVLASLKKLGCG